MPTTAPPDAVRPILRGLSPREASRPAREILAAIPWDSARRRDTLPAAAFLAAIDG